MSPARSSPAATAPLQNNSGKCQGPDRRSALACVLGTPTYEPTGGARHDERRGRMLNMRRRDFLGLLGGAASPWLLSPLAARAETAAAPRRVGVLSTLVEDTAETRRLNAVLVAGLHELGWTEGRNLRLEQRWSAGDNDRLRSDARALADLRAEVVMAIATPAVAVR